MFIKRVGKHIIIFNDDMKLIIEYFDAKIEEKNNRITIVKDDGTPVCDMPKESTSILYN